MKAIDTHGVREVRHGGPLRAGLALMAATVLPTGLWALASPRSFYDTFPFPGWRWVSTLGPFDEHLIRDYGAMNLAQGYPDFPAPEFIKQAAIDSINADINQYAITWGSPRLRRAATCRLVTRHSFINRSNVW